MPKFIAAAATGEPPVIFGDGEQTRDFTYVENAVHANLLACRAPRSACGEVYNVGCGERTSVNDLWSRIREMVGAETEADHDAARTGDVRDSLASLERIYAQLGYDPVVTFDEGLRRTVEAFTSHV